MAAAFQIGVLEQLQRDIMEANTDFKILLDKSGLTKQQLLTISNPSLNSHLQKKNLSQNEIKIIKLHRATFKKRCISYYSFKTVNFKDFVTF